MSTQADKITPGVWVDAMLATMVRQHNGRLQITATADKDGVPTFTATVTINMVTTVVRLREQGHVASTVLRALGKQLEAWESRQ